MKAMILAAGLGTRLRPLTDKCPKALVEIDGRTMLEITIRRLKQAGVNEVIVNAFHFAEMIVEYLRSHNHFGIRIEVSLEDTLLDTGGGLKKVSHFFDDGTDLPFILHNVDVLSNIDLGRMMGAHKKHQALATLAVQHRETSRYLLFDQQLELCGRRAANSEPEVIAGRYLAQELAFSGIHIISPRLLPMLTEEGAFSIVTSYLRLAAEGEKIMAFRADDYYWRDLGKPESVAQAAQDLKQNLIG